jgi:hypothetical protein
MTETSERPLLWIEGMITLGLGVTLLARARRLLWWSALVLRAPIARSGTALDFGALEGIARAATPVRRLESAFHLRWAQQHGGTQASYLTVEHRYARAPTFEVELADGTRAPVVDADGALWATGARTLVDEGGNRTLTESIDDGAPLLVVGPFTGAGIEGAGPESVLLVGARSGSSARASLVRACVAAVLPGAAVIVLGVLVALASLAT